MSCLFVPQQKTNWITEDDFYRPHPEAGRSRSGSPSPQRPAGSHSPVPSGALDQGSFHVTSETGKAKLSPEQESKGFSVVHRRQMGNWSICCSAEAGETVSIKKNGAISAEDFMQLQSGFCWRGAKAQLFLYP